MKILVCGSRGFTDYQFLKKKLDHLTEKLFEVEIVIKGTKESTIDKLADWWGWKNHYPRTRFHLDPEKYGKNATNARNSEMVKYVKEHNGVCLVFGSDDDSNAIISEAKKQGLKIKKITIEEE